MGADAASTFLRSGKLSTTDYVESQSFNLFKIRDLGSLAIRTPAGPQSPGEPDAEAATGNGLIIWSYTDQRNLGQTTIDGLTTTAVRQSACQRSAEYSAAYGNIARVVYKFNQMPDHDRVVTWKGRVIYSYGYTNDNIYCIKWGQSLGAIDDSNYYTPEETCGGRWETIAAYNACRTRAKALNAARIF